MFATEAPAVAPTVNPEDYTGLVQALLRRRDEAVAARKSSGIESDWIEDNEFCLGIDDANRAFVRSTFVQSIKRGAPTSQGPDGARSTVFVNITAPYVQAAAARIADMLLPTDERCWAIKPTPIAEMGPTLLAQLQQIGVDGEAAQEAMHEEAERKAEAMGDAIDDALTEADWHGVVRQVIEDAATLGTGILKGPIPTKRTNKVWRVIDGVPQLEIVEEIKPGVERIDPWNFYPARDCGENIHSGRDIWERSFSSSKQLQELVPMPGYDAEAIASCLKDGPRQVVAREAGDGSYIPLAHNFELWTGYARISAEEALTGGLQVDNGDEMVDVMVVLCNDKLIKLSLNALETGEFPYDVLAWQRRPGMWAGMGVARQIRTPQRIVNSASRAMMDNAAMTAGVQMVIGNGIYPADGKFEVRGRKTWRAEPDVLDVRQAFYAFVPPSFQQEFQAIINYGLEMAERVTGMPALLQGQQTNLSPGSKTVGGLELMQNNASGALRRLAKRFDDAITEPHIRRWYHWMLQFDEREEIKGDYEVDARGSSALVQRDSNRQFLYASLNVAMQPAYGIDPRKLYAELCRAEYMDPETVQYTDEEYQQQQSGTGESAVDQAKAALAEAQAAQVKADTVLKNIEALFAATQAANLIAANPALAPAADATAKSAGFVDQDAPPIMGQPPAGAEPIPMPENTSPMFPAHPGTPVSPVDGVKAGIEGGNG